MKTLPIIKSLRQVFKHTFAQFTLYLKVKVLYQAYTFYWTRGSVFQFTSENNCQFRKTLGFTLVKKVKSNGFIDYNLSVEQYYWPFLGHKINLASSISPVAWPLYALAWKTKVFRKSFTFSYIPTTSICNFSPYFPNNIWPLRWCSWYSVRFAIYNMIRLSHQRSLKFTAKFTAICLLLQSIWLNLQFFTCNGDVFI